MPMHPYNQKESIPPDTRILIVGTAPPPRFDGPKKLRGDDFDFFYGSEDNCMWEYLGKIAEEIDHAKLFNRTEVLIDGKSKIKYTDTSDECCEMARSFLQGHHLWMKDIFDEYERKTGDEHLAADDAIKDPALSACTDFAAALRDNTRISTLAFTSRKAAIWTMKRLTQQKLLRDNLLSELVRRIQTQKERGEFWNGKILERNIKFVLLPSPSGRMGCDATNVPLYKKLLFSP